MSKRVYGQYCGFARALELVGERWALLVVRDLLVSPKRFSDLQRGLPGIPTNILTARLKEMEEAGVVQRRVLPRPSGAVVYELTPIGRDLEPAVHALGRWGAKLLGDPRPDEVLTPDSLLTALLTTFQPKAAKGVTASYELHMGDIVINARVRNGNLSVDRGPLPEADAILESGPALRALMAREITPREALKTGAVKLTGKRELLDRFVDVFRI
ncbi:MAG TPA: helix-turn-helix domain-containing protein [Candidatus Baltobacteraceae bacterium]|nr:helix-turn-helix domain-containing protein [Candidatus Baltobacteraceae bacterium]